MGEKVEAETDTAHLDREVDQSWGRTRSEVHLATNAVFEFGSRTVDRFEIDLNLKVKIYWEAVFRGCENFALDAAALIKLGSTSGLFAGLELFDSEPSLA